MPAPWPGVQPTIFNIIGELISSLNKFSLLYIPVQYIFTWMCLLLYVSVFYNCDLWTWTMDILPSVDIFRELQDIHDTGYFSVQPSLDDHWQQVINSSMFFFCFKSFSNLSRLILIPSDSLQELIPCHPIRHFLFILIV